jgi:hypothetical protein
MIVSLGGYMKKFLTRFWKYLLEFTRPILLRFPYFVVNGIFAYMLMTAPVMSSQQLGWLFVYTFMTSLYFTYCDVVREISSKVSVEETLDSAK